MWVMNCRALDGRVERCAATDAYGFDCHARVVGNQMRGGLYIGVAEGV